jgi:hypothetical protein
MHPASSRLRIFGVIALLLAVAAATGWALSIYLGPNLTLDLASFMQMCASLLNRK